MFIYVFIIIFNYEAYMQQLAFLEDAVDVRLCRKCIISFNLHNDLIL